MDNRIEQAKEYLEEHEIDGWLLYDFHNLNSLALDFLEIPKGTHITRRFFYWIPKKGTPIQLVHCIEPHVLSHLPGEKKTYQKYKDLRKHLEEMLRHCKCVAMEYSEENHLPYISKIDAGTKEFIENIGPTVTSSGPFLQQFTCTMDDNQIDMHKEAAIFVDKLADDTFNYIKEGLTSGKVVNEYEVQQWMLKQMKENGFTWDFAPTVAFAEHTADPHYSPKDHETSKNLNKQDLVLLDICSKKDSPKSIYADITRMAIAANEPTEKQKEVYAIVREAQEETFNFIKRRYELKEIVKGFEADEICRDFITERGYGDQFFHRTGHNIYQTVHGPGAHLDSLETLDDRPLIPNTAFTIEPGIYFPGDFGVRVEYDVFIHNNGVLENTTGAQDTIRCLL
ncbi:peptidase [Candidatus Aerophobetes bacterium]|uniref:Peptidase n=1 Tax=Aerophobetes bacterium TaxID=2030807 RepID=A0A2A4YE71_UNCAE|nr:MAG: peptidase [Candidatus Aerophobetes bacterium]